MFNPFKRTPKQYRVIYRDDRSRVTISPVMPRADAMGVFDFDIFNNASEVVQIIKKR